MKTNTKKTVRALDAMPDIIDFRDKIYVPTLVEVPLFIALENYQKIGVPILDQGQEGACTGFGLATVVNYLLKTRKVISDKDPVSPRMIYVMAKKYDEWPGVNYSGSSARGAMKGWHKHGVCSSEVWPYIPQSNDTLYTPVRSQDALKRPLGAYFRVNHKDIVAMHSAIAETGILYVTSTVHEGWDKVGKNGIIPPGNKPLGGHAFAIVAYDEKGFWIQNSWGNKWGKAGFGHISYDDWLENGTDVWVARLGAPVVLENSKSNAIRFSVSASAQDALTYNEMRPHIVSIGNDGLLKTTGTYGNDMAEIDQIFNSRFPEITKNWKKKRIMVYAHGGLVAEDNELMQRLADFRHTLLAKEIYPIFFVWHTGFKDTLINILKDALKYRKPEGFFDAAWDFILDRADDSLEPLARIAGKVLWDQMKQNAILSTKQPNGGARIICNYLINIANKPGCELHFVAHSAGSIFVGPMLQLLATNGIITKGPLEGEKGKSVNIKTATLWAPACTVQFFKDIYIPILANNISKFTLFTLTDKAEQDDDCAKIYNKSLLYLVSNSLEEVPHILFQNGTPILGMAKWIYKDKSVLDILKKDGREWILSPNTEPIGSISACGARHHGDFDDDKKCFSSTVARILGSKSGVSGLSFSKSARTLKIRREYLLR